MSVDPGTRVYRGPSLEELLPRIREELGPDALIVRQREGILGGFAGFFGKRCVEVEVRQGTARVSPSLPPRVIADAYAGAGADDGWGVTEQSDDRSLVQTLIAQASPFVAELALAEERAGREPALLDDEDGEPEEEKAPLLARVRATRAGAEETAAALRASGLPEEVVVATLALVGRHLRALEPDAAYADLARRALARTIRVRHEWRTRRRTIALIGPPGAGKTLVAAKLCLAYAAGPGLATVALSLEEPRGAVRLGLLTEDADVELAIAPTPAVARRAAAALGGYDLVVADTPAFAPARPASIERLAQLLAALKPDEVHLVLPAATPLAAAQRALAAARGRVSVDRIALTHLDLGGSLGGTVGLAIRERRPLSFLSGGDLPRAGLRAADPAVLAELVLP
jgi:flagellar biosynthesis GTPase FlhF